MESLSQKHANDKNIFCAIDLHDQSMLAGISIDKGEIEYYPLNTQEDKGVKQLIKTLDKLRRENEGCGLYVSYESSGAGFRLADILEGNGFDVFVLPTSHLPISQKSRSEKTDKRDVVRIMNMLRSHFLAGSELPVVWKPSLVTRDHRELVRHRLSLGESVTKVKNKIHGLLKRNGLRKPKGVRNWSTDYFIWLEDVCFASSSCCRSALSSLLRELEFYHNEKSIVDQAILELSSDDMYFYQVREITKLKGVGLLTAMVFLTELGDLGRFPNRRALSCYLGLVPRSYESGEGVERKGHISRLGSSRLRKVLNQAAWVAVKWDPYWGKWFKARTEIDGLSEKKKQDLRKKLITAVMRKLAILMWHTGLAASGC